MDDTNFVLAMSYLCLVLLSALVQDVSTREVDWEACTPLIDDAWTLVDIPLSDMTLLVIKSRRTSLTDSSTVVSSSDICTWKR
jgi:hypothetical protein